MTFIHIFMYQFTNSGIEYLGYLPPFAVLIHFPTKGLLQRFNTSDVARVVVVKAVRWR